MQEKDGEIAEDSSPDSRDRIEDFLARHGGARGEAKRGQSGGGTQGWTEVYAADGYTLRCDWSRFGSRDEMKYAEIAPAGGS
jgi:hypothetical protein